MEKRSAQDLQDRHRKILKDIEELFERIWETGECTLQNRQERSNEYYKVICEMADMHHDLCKARLRVEELEEITGVTLEL